MMKRRLPVALSTVSDCEEEISPSQLHIIVMNGVDSAP